VIKKIEALNGRGSGQDAGAAAAAGAVRAANGSTWQAQQLLAGGGGGGSNPPSGPLPDGAADISEVSFAVKKAHFKAMLQSKVFKG
jgi:hypothetical protein